MSMFKVGPTPSPSHGVIITATALHLLRRRIVELGGFKKLSYLGHVAGFKELWTTPVNHVLSKPSPFCLCVFNGNKQTQPQNEPTNSPGTRQMTNVLLALNVLVYIAQFASQGKLLLWGAKINSLVDQGQIWRLVTSSFLHANIGHLMVNCYSLNSIGPTMESFCGRKRYVAIYFASAVASSVMSYRLCTAPSVGASGAIFGLVGSVAVFVLRHQGLVGGGKEELKHLAQVIVLNMVIGVMSKGIDNWGHLGGLLGGVATSYLVGPAWKYESLSNDGRRVFADKAPIKYLFNRKKTPPRLN